MSPDTNCMQQASLTYTLKHQINRHRKVRKFNGLAKRSRDHWNRRKVYIRRQRTDKTIHKQLRCRGTTICSPKQPCYRCKSHYEPFFASLKHGVRRFDIGLLREHDGNAMAFVGLDHSGMQRSMGERNGKSQLFKYTCSNLCIGCC